MSFSDHPLWYGICPECVGFGYTGVSKCGYCRGSGRRFRKIPHDSRRLAASAQERLATRRKPMGREENLAEKERKTS